MIKFFTENIFIILVSICFLCLVSLGINLPYVGPNAANLNNYSLIAKNYNKFGFIDTKFAEIVSVSPALPNNPSYYLNHPPLLGIIQSLFFRLFGYDFWVGRLTVILFSFDSLVLIYLIGKKILDKKYALIASLIYLCIPASTIFGKLIGQESLVLFFGLLTIYGVSGYLHDKSKKHFGLVIISIILGTLSDWPMTYFSLLVCIYLFLKKERKMAISVLVASILTALVYLAYVGIILSGFSIIMWAIKVRSIGTLFFQSLWPIKWFLAIATRFAVYFGPIFAGLGIYYIFRSATNIPVKKSEKDIFYISLVWFSFGLVHILLYPDGSFGHPYWIYYFIPFIVFSSSFFIKKILESNRYLTYLLFGFSIVFLFVIQYWKYEQIKSNIWRYDLAKKVDLNLNAYEPIAVNLDSAIDRELTKYVFSHEVSLIEDVTKINFPTHKYFVYSCAGICNKEDKMINILFNTYPYKKISEVKGEAYIFYLTSSKVPMDIGSMKTSNSADKTKTTPKGLGNLYKVIRNILNVPQI